MRVGEQKKTGERAEKVVDTKNDVTWFGVTVRVEQFRLINCAAQDSDRDRDRDRDRRHIDPEL